MLSAPISKMGGSLTITMKAFCTRLGLYLPNFTNGKNMKNNKFFKWFSLVLISFFWLSATHVAAENFVNVKNNNKKYAVVFIEKKYIEDPLAISECLRKGESIKFNLDEVGIEIGSEFKLWYATNYDCDWLKDNLSRFENCQKRKNGAPVKWVFQRTTSTGTKKFQIKSNQNCVLK